MKKQPDPLQRSLQNIRARMKDKKAAHMLPMLQRMERTVLDAQERHAKFRAEAEALHGRHGNRATRRAAAKKTARKPTKRK